MRMQRKQFRIGELASKLNVEKFVVRFWEKEFNIKTTRSSGKQRFYSENDVKTFTLIKDLLYNKGFTISGAKKQLSSKVKSSRSKIIASQRTTIEKGTHQEFIKKCLSIKKDLLKLKKLL